MTLETKVARDQSGLSDREPNHRALDAVKIALRDLRFGEVTVIVQDGRIIQVNRTEKCRITKTE